MSAGVSQKRDFTVKTGPSSLCPPEQQPTEECNNLLLVCMKWVTAIVIFGVVLSCTVISKVSLAMLANKEPPAGNGSNAVDSPLQKYTGLRATSKEREKRDLLVVLIVIMFIPEVVGFLRACWMWSFKNRDQFWPCRSAVLWCMFGATLEVLGLCFFGVVVSTVVRLPPDVYVIVLMCPTLWPFLATLGAEGQHVLQSVLLVVSSLLNLGGLAGVLFLVWKFSDASYVQTALLPISLIFLAVAWCPIIRNRQTQLPAAPVGTLGTVSPISATPVLKADNARDSATLITSAWKLLLIVPVSCAYAAIFSVTELKHIDVHNTFKNLDDRTTEILYAHVFSSLVGYMAGIFACQMRFQHIGFALPLLLSSPCAFLFTKLSAFCKWKVVSFLPTHGGCGSEEYLWVVLAAAIALWGAQYLSVCVHLFRTTGVPLLKESRLFWFPYYNSMFLEQFMLLNKKDKVEETVYRGSTDFKVFICTSMWHEKECEMKDYLLSLRDVDNHAERDVFEAHVFVDEGVEGTELKNYSLQLLSLLNETLQINASDGHKASTPYGLLFKWELQNLLLFVHLKDSEKVKGKKRWNQVMLSSFILDFKDEKKDTYILSTDGDVKFSWRSVEKLLYQMIADQTVGAAGGRVFPIGSGPVFWYQRVEYCLSHWQNKVANHVLGTMQISSACVTLYRAEAIKNVLRVYSASSQTAFEFLARDMGEEQWLGSLLVQAGWRVVYCSEAQVWTYCPESFDEVFHQRRRWISSTVANLLHMVTQWRTITVHNNQFANIVYVFYQFMIACSIMLSPSTVILTLALLVEYCLPDLVFLPVLLILAGVVFVYMVIHVVPSQTVQILVPKLATFIFSIVVLALTALTIARVATDIGDGWKQLHAFTVYLLVVFGIVLVSALLHPREAIDSLLHSLWYLMCMPPVAVTTVIFAMFNITDTTWGTREEKEESPQTFEDSVAALDKIKWILTCCRGQLASPLDAKIELPHSTEAVASAVGEVSNAINTATAKSAPEKDKSGDRPDDSGTTLKLPHLTIEEWFSIDGIQFKNYVNMFLEQGYDDVSFVEGMTEKELYEVGVHPWAHRQRLMKEIDRIPKIDIKMRIPTDVEEWLVELGLEMYWPKFQKLGYTTDERMIEFRELSEEDLKEQLGVTKVGYLKKMMKGMRHLYHPDETHRRLVEARKEVEVGEIATLTQVNGDDGAEARFWTDLLTICLSPVFDVFSQGEEMVKKLRVLKQYVLMAFIISNLIWLVSFTVLFQDIVGNLKSRDLGTVAFFLVALSLLSVLQFLSLLWYRFWSVFAYVTIQPWIYRNQPQNAFSYTSLSAVHIQNRNATP